MTEEKRRLIVVDGNDGNEKVADHYNRNRRRPIIVLFAVVGLFVLSAVGYYNLISLKDGVTSSSSLSMSSVLSSTEIHDNYLYFQENALIGVRFSNYREHGVTEGQPWGGPEISNNYNGYGDILVKSGRKGSRSVAAAFWKNAPQYSSSNPDNYYPMNFYIIVDLDMQDFGTIKNIGLGQLGVDGENLWKISSPNCMFDETTRFYTCTCTNGHTYQLMLHNSNTFYVYGRKG